MMYVFYGLFILACVILIIAVLLQPGKADAGALFSGSVNSTAFGARGTATLLAKITIGAAASFFLIALLMSQPALTGQRSTLDTTPDTGAVPAPTVAPPAPAPGAPAPVDPNAPATITPPDASTPATTASPKAETAPATAPAASPAKAPAQPTRKPNGN